MLKEKTLNIITGTALVLMMAFICYKLTDQFAPEYPEPTVKYTDSAFESLEYQNAQNVINLKKANEFIRSLADGNL